MGRGGRQDFDALDPGLHLRLLTVVEPPIFAVAPEVPSGMPPIDQVVRDRQAEAERTLRRVEADFEEKITAVDCSVVVGHAGEHIVSAANDPGTDLVVVGARGLGAFKRLLLGSVSESVLHHAECPGSSSGPEGPEPVASGGVAALAVLAVPPEVRLACCTRTEQKARNSR